MAVAFAWFLAALHAVATPLGRRFRASALWAGRAISIPGDDAPTRELTGRGWHALLVADLWILPALGAGILLFQHPWQVVPLVVAAFGGAFLLDRLPVWPSTVDWYLARLRGQMEGRVARAESGGEAGGTGGVEAPGAAGTPAGILHALEDLEARYAGRGVRPPSPSEAARAPAGDPDWLLRVRGTDPDPSGPPANSSGSEE